MSISHLAFKANQRSTQMAAAKEKEAWLALYDSHAIIRDPVGKSPLDPEGKGHQGQAAISQFWDQVIAPASMKITIESTIPSGPLACAVVQSVSNELPSGQLTVIKMIASYHVNQAGLITEMNAYWDFDDLIKQLSNHTQ